MKSGSLIERLGALFLMGTLLISPPLLAVFRGDLLVAGVPLLFLYLFAAWALLVGLLALIVETGREPEPGAEPGEPKRQA
jgi:hypothetical protein